LVEGSTDPFGVDENWAGACSTDIQLDAGDAKTSPISGDDSFCLPDADEWQSPGITAFLPEEALAWAEETCPLYFDRLLDLTPEAAKAFVHHDWVAFDGLTTLRDETAKVLAGYQGTCLFLRGLTTLSAEAAAALRANPRIVLPDNFTEAPE